MTITAAQVNELRQLTGAGLMTCKKALQEANGDLDAAKKAMEMAGLAQANKKSGRTAAEGVVVVEASADGQLAAMLEVNCETDFVTRNDDFKAFVSQLIKRVMDLGVDSLDAFLSSPFQEGGSETVEEARQTAIVKIGENIQIRRLACFRSDAGGLAHYSHGARIGVLVELDKANSDLGKDLAMQVAAARPLSIREEDIPAEVIAERKEVFLGQAAQSGKPAEIAEKMVVGKLRKFATENTLLGQAFIKNPDETVAQLLDAAGATVVNFTCFEVGEGIEKEESNFAEEVKAQLEGRG